MATRKRLDSANPIVRDLDAFISKRDEALAMKATYRRSVYDRHPYCMTDKIYRMEKSTRDQDLRDQKLFEKLKSASVTAQEIIQAELVQYQDPIMQSRATLKLHNTSLRRRAAAIVLTPRSPRNPNKHAHGKCSFSLGSSPRVSSVKIPALSLSRWSHLQERCEEASRSHRQVRRRLQSQEQQTRRHLEHILDTSQRLSELSGMKASVFPELYSLKKYEHRESQIDALKAVWECKDILV